MVKPIFALAKVSDKISDMTKTDCLRIKRNLGWYIQTGQKNKHITLDMFVRNIKAVVCHLFHDHEWCDRSWCPFKDMNEKEMEMFRGPKLHAQDISTEKKIQPLRNNI